MVQVVLQIVLRVMCEARSRSLSSRRGLCRACPARLRLALSFALQPEACATCLASSCRPVLGAALVALQTPVGRGRAWPSPLLEAVQLPLACWPQASHSRVWCGEMFLPRRGWSRSPRMIMRLCTNRSTWIRNLAAKACVSSGGHGQSPRYFLLSIFPASAPWCFVVVVKICLEYRKRHTSHVC